MRIVGVRKILLVAALGLTASACSLGGSRDQVIGYPEIDFRVPVEVYKETVQRDLNFHVFRPASGDSIENPPGVVLFFHGGGFRTTRVEQFERQARAVSEAGMVGIVVEYRVTLEGTSRQDAIDDGLDAVAELEDNAGRFAIDPERIAIAGSSAGGALATEASESVDALVLFNPAVGPSSAPFVGEQPTLVFHSREDQTVAFASADGFCDAVTNCTMVAFDEGDHGFFNDDPAFTETTNQMIEFLQSNGW